MVDTGKIMRLGWNFATNIRSTGLIYAKYTENLNLVSKYQKETED